uniref:Uncharacterized protein n=1 Tax=Arundo donax TaxID=35708 RepID=A0A0A9F9J0_ARUDO
MLWKHAKIENFRVNDINGWVSFVSFHVPLRFKAPSFSLWLSIVI